ncbi:YceI family protein [Nocardiopsis metallicus]|uniref:Polyisoprenoid-binding protein YceI n=1 Tax=Nocardiopsis metallicus TaxID=179819 RepID=A0A840WG03_9ACTN|nr:YceI family protein [Nocardiopsis metallicus]MBB5490875.1 polyisoprenoid-binding protein YceI [Nocardiopsis metallicus]
MRTGAKIALGSGAAVVVLAGAAFALGPRLYAERAEQRVQDAPVIEGSGDTADLDAADFEGTWTVAEGASYAGYRVDEILNGQEVTVTGRTPEVQGTVTVAEGSITAATVTVDMASVTTDESARDGYFRDSALDVGTYPTSEFALTDPVELTPGDDSVALSGDLTIRGVAQPVTLEARVGVTDTGAQVAGSIPIAFADFGVDAPDLGFVTVEDEGAVEFLLDLVREQ